MKKELKQNYQSGHSTFELMVAIFILVITISGIITVIFGNQFLSVDTEMNNIGIAKAQDLLDEQRGNAKNNFSGIIAGVSTDGPYTKKVSVNDINQCQKQVTAEVSWYDGVKQKKVLLSTLVNDLNELKMVAGTCSETGPTNTTCPSSLVTASINYTLPGGGTFNSIIQNSQRVYLATTPIGTGSTNFDYLTFPVNFNFSTNISVPVFPSGVRTSSGGLNELALDQARGFVFGAGRWTSGGGQLQIINNSDITRPASIAFLLPNNTQNGLSIYFSSNKVYIGTTANPSGPEFYIVDVSNPEAPEVLATKEIGFSVNEIYIRGDIAYLSTSDPNAEVKTYDVSQVISTSQPGVINNISNGTFNAPLLSGAKSLYLIGATLFLGDAGTKNFYMINSQNLSAMSEINSINIGNTILDMAVSGNLAYSGVDLGTTGKLDVRNVADLANPISCSAVNQNYPVPVTGVTYGNNLVYVLLNSGSSPVKIIKFQ